VVVDNFYVTGAVNTPSEADTPLLVDADTVLSLPVPSQCLEPVARQVHEVFQARCTIENLQSSIGLLGNGLKPVDAVAVIQLLSMPARK
jgi:hypothetical protein